MTRPAATRKHRITVALVDIRRGLIIQREMLKGLMDMSDPPSGPEVQQAKDAVAIAVEKVQRACRRRGL